MVLGGPLGLFFVWVTQTRINTANYFLSTTNLQAFLRETLRIRLPKFFSAVLVGLLVLGLLISTNVLKYILIAVNYQAVILAAWVGVALAHILASRNASHPSTPGAETLRPALNMRGLLAWGASTAGGFAVMQATGALATLSVPVTLAIAGLGYGLLPASRAP